MQCYVVSVKRGKLPKPGNKHEIDYLKTNRFIVVKVKILWHFALGNASHVFNGNKWNVVALNKLKVHVLGTLINFSRVFNALTHWGRATHICASKLTIIASDNGLSPGRSQAIIWNNAGIVSIGLLGTNFSEIFIEILTFSFKKMRLKVSSAKWRPFCLGLNVLRPNLVALSQIQQTTTVISEHG